MKIKKITKIFGEELDKMRRSFKDINNYLTGVKSLF